jgi:hypothetical protein
VLVFQARRKAGPAQHQAKRRQARPDPVFEGVQASRALQALAFQAWVLQALAFEAEQVSAVVRLGEEWLERCPFPLKAAVAGRPDRSFSSPQALALSTHARSSWDLRSFPASPDVF